MTKREFVSSVLTDAKLNSKDVHIPRRHILNKGISVAETYMAQRLDKGDLTFESDIVSRIDCFELAPVEGIKCGIVDLKTCNRVMKSVNKLPKPLKGRIGAGIISITSLDGEYEFKPTTSRQFKNKLKNKYVRDKESYYIVEDDFIILPNSEVEYVSIEYVTLTPEETAGCDCNNDGNEEEDCKTIWDTPFICPQNIYTLVRDKVIQEIASVYLQVRADENPDLDENTRTTKKA